MSASNWRDCPKCAAKRRAEQEAAEQAAAEAYGKMPRDEWLRLTREAERPRESVCGLREEYGVGVCENGEFYVNYSCLCVECNWSWKFKHEEKVPL